MKKILITIILLYSAHFVYYNFVNPPDEQTYITNKVMFDFSNQQYKKRKLTLWAFGKERGKLFEKFNNLSLSFFTNNELTIDTGRKLLLDLANEFLENINKTIKMEQYLHPYPFNYFNICLSLSVSDPIQGHKYYSEGFTKNNKITYLILSRGVITYYIHTFENLPMREVLEEKIEDAFKILKSTIEI